MGSPPNKRGQVPSVQDLQELKSMVELVLVESNEAMSTNTISM